MAILFLKIRKHGSTHPFYMHGLHLLYTYSGTSLYGHFGTLILVLITEVSLVQRSFNTVTLHWDKEWCPYYRGFCNSEVCNREVPLYIPFSLLYTEIHYYVFSL